MPEWEDVYGGWEEYYRKVMSGDAWSGEAEPAVEALVKGAGQERVHVADLGCGEGRNTIPWLRRESAKHDARESRPRITLRPENMRSLRWGHRRHGCYRR